MIEGVEVYDLKKIPDSRGTIMHMMRNDNEYFKEFGEIYFSTAYPGVIKGWHLHKEMELNYAVVSGMVKLVLYDSREESSTYGEVNELYLGNDNYILVKVPNYVWNAFENIGTETCILANCSTIPHNPNEIVREKLNSGVIPYDWNRKI